MSDDEYLYDETLFEDVGDDANAAIDSLACNSMPSPVWISYDPDTELVYYDSDYESADEYFDAGKLELRPRKRQKCKTGTAYPVTEAKRREISSPTEDVGDISLTDHKQIIHWRNSNDRGLSPEVPLVRDGDLVPISLLKDWKEQFYTYKGPQDLSTDFYKSEEGSDQVPYRLLRDNVDDEEGDLQSQDESLNLPPTSLKDLDDLIAVKEQPETASPATGTQVNKGLDHRNGHIATDSHLITQTDEGPVRTDLDMMTEVEGDIPTTTVHSKADQPRSKSSRKRKASQSEIEPPSISHASSLGSIDHPSTSPSAELALPLPTAKRRQGTRPIAASADTLTSTPPIRQTRSSKRNPSKK